MPQKDELRRIFHHGVAAGLSGGLGIAPHIEPTGAERNIETRLQAPWLSDTCPVCRHSFRLGDRVARFADGRIVHDMTDLPCCGTTTQRDTDHQSGLTREAFFRGLFQAWPMPSGIPVVRLEHGQDEHGLLSPPVGGSARNSCRICGHTFRPGDHVVICPCSPQSPRCIAAVHRDLIRNLSCWDNWKRYHPKADQVCLGAT